MANAQTLAYLMNVIREEVNMSRVPVSGLPPDDELKQASSIKKLLATYCIHLNMDKSLAYNEYVITTAAQIKDIVRQTCSSSVIHFGLPTLVRAIDDRSYWRIALCLLGEQPCSNGINCCANRDFGMILRQYRNSSKCIYCSRITFRILRANFMIEGSDILLTLSTVCYVVDSPGEYCSSYMLSSMGRPIESLKGCLGPIPATEARHLEVCEHTVTLRDMTTKTVRGLIECADCFYNGVRPSNLSSYTVSSSN